MRAKSALELHSKRTYSTAATPETPNRILELAKGFEPLTL